MLEVAIWFRETLPVSPPSLHHPTTVLHPVLHLFRLQPCCCVVHIRENPPVFFLLTGAWNPDYPKLPEIWHDETYIQCNSVYKILQSPVSLVYRNLTIKIQRAAV